MERDLSYDEAITPEPTLGHVVVLSNPIPGEYHDTLGVTAEKREVLTLDPLDGPILLEQWALGKCIAYDGAEHETPDDDPEALHLSGESLLGTMSDGKLVFTGPIVETRYAGQTMYAQACDGLLFQLGTPKPEWLAVNAEPDKAVARFMDEYAPLSTEGWQRGVMR